MSPILSPRHANGIAVLNLHPTEIDSHETIVAETYLANPGTAKIHVMLMRTMDS